jgi:hypothetical protein
MSSIWKYIYLCSQDLTGLCISGQGPVNTVLCTREIFTDRTVASSVHYFIFGGGEPGLLTLCRR